MNSVQQCPVCMNDAKVSSTFSAGVLTRQVECPRCGGPFLLDENLADMMWTGYYKQDYQKIFSKRRRCIASSLLRQQSRMFRLKTNNVESFCEARDLPMLEKADKLLLWIEKNVSSVEGFQQRVSIDITDLSLQALCWAMNTDELHALFVLLRERNFLECERTTGDGCYAAITAKGWERIEQLRAPNMESSQGFVAMWFAPEMTDIYKNVLAPAIQSAGYEPHRVDQSEHIDKIDDEIIRQIRRSRFVVADATGHRGGVYYEAGFAHGLRLPVFWTCREDALKDLHFDVNHYNCIVWSSDKLNEFRAALVRRIEAVLGRGTHPTM